MSADKAGTDLEVLARDWGHFEIDYAPDWSVVEDEFQDQSRWCTHWRKILRHEDGMTVAVEYARNTGDGDSADAYPDEWYEVEPYEDTVTIVRWRKKEGS